MKNTVAIEESTCVSCGACTRTCFFDKLKLSEDKKHAVVIDDKPCFGCGQCADICPTQSVSLNGKKAVKISLPSNSAEVARALVLKRRSIRNFKPNGIPKEKLKEILDIASAGAPSGRNGRRCHCIVINGEEKLRKISEHVINKMKEAKIPALQRIVEEFESGKNPITYNASQLLVIWDKYEEGIFGAGIKKPANFEAGILSETIELLLEANGYGSVYVGFISTLGVDDELLKLLYIPENGELMMCLAIGEPATSYPNASVREPHPVTFIE